MATLIDKGSTIAHIIEAKNNIPDNGMRTRAIKEGLEIAQREIEMHRDYDNLALLNRIAKTYWVDECSEFTVDSALSIGVSVNKTLKVVGLYDKYKMMAKLVNRHWVVTFKSR